MFFSVSVNQFLFFLSIVFMCSVLSFFSTIFCPATISTAKHFLIFLDFTGALKTADGYSDFASLSGVSLLAPDVIPQPVISFSAPNSIGFCEVKNNFNKKTAVFFVYFFYYYYFSVVAV